MTGDLQLLAQFGFAIPAALPNVQPTERLRNLKSGEFRDCIVP
jgi:hypothetical protein